MDCYCMLRIRSRTYSYAINLIRDWPGSRCALHANQNVNKEKYGEFKTNTQTQGIPHAWMWIFTWCISSSMRNHFSHHTESYRTQIANSFILIWKYLPSFQLMRYARVCVCVCLVSFRFPFCCEYFSLNFIVRSSSSALFLAFPAHYSSGFDIYSLA